MAKTRRFEVVREYPRGCPYKGEVVEFSGTSKQMESYFNGNPADQRREESIDGVRHVYYLRVKAIIEKVTEVSRGSSFLFSKKLIV